MPDIADLWVSPGLIAAALAVVLVVLTSVRVAQEYQRAVMFRFGRQTDLRGPGLFLKLPFIERAAIVDIRTITKQLETQETVTRDGVAVRLNAVVWYRAADPARTIVAVRDWNDAVKQAAETAMRDTVGQHELDQLLKDRLNANLALKTLLTGAVEKWGVEISAVELKDLDIPETMQRAIAKEAEAIREKRARIIKAEGELDASHKLLQAAETMSGNPIALELRRLQTLTEIGAENNSVIIMPMPMDAGATTSAAAMARAIEAARVTPGSGGHPGAGGGRL